MNRADKEFDLEKIGIIDLGSNSARLVIVNLFDEGYFMVVDELKQTVRLGQDMEADGFLKPQRVNETIKTLKMFRRLCEASGVSRIIAVATAAVRRAKNQRSFLDEIQANCGIKIKVLSAEEEALLVYRGVINTMDIPKGIILEIGGGATKIVYYNRRNVLNHVTLPFGAMTLTSKFADSDLKPEEQAKKVEEYVAGELSQIDWLQSLDPDTRLIGVGGSFRNLFKINKMVRKYPLDTVHNYVMDTDDFLSVYDMIKVLDLDKKKKIKGLSAERADILPAAFAIIKSFTGHIGVSKITFSGAGLREGIMFNQANPQTMEKPISDVLGYSLNTLVKYYGCEEHHVEHVLQLSGILFKQLRVLHKFPRANLRILKIAAALHDCGMRIKYYNHQRHSCYMILNSTLYGVTHREIVLAAFTACCHKREDISAYEWAKYKDILNDDDLEIVKKLGVILRIAESLDRSMSGVVTGIDCDILGDSVIMKTTTEGDADLEIRDALSAAAEFKKSFHKNLEIL
ncbi:MAG: Ppx/GppA family phosphatase [Clostridia bacterium]|nr:Ppx/GppA family phosphatase [Clostridia bacterium]